MLNTYLISDAPSGREEERMSWLRAGLGFIIATSPFALVLVLAQSVDYSKVAGEPDPFVLWLHNPTTLAIAIAGLLGGLADSMLRPPKNIGALMQHVMFSLIASVMLLPYIVESWFSGVSISGVMFGSFLSSMSAQRLVPRILDLFNSRVDLVLLREKKDQDREREHGE